MLVIWTVSLATKLLAGILRFDLFKMQSTPTYMELEQRRRKRQRAQLKSKRFISCAKITNLPRVHHAFWYI